MPDQPHSKFDRFLQGLGLAFLAAVVAGALLIVAGFNFATPGFGFTAVMTLIACTAIVYVAAKGVGICSGRIDRSKADKYSPRMVAHHERELHRRTFTPPLQLAD